MRDVQQPCPVCLADTICSVNDDIDGATLDCRRCGTYLITPDARELLTQSTAPAPTGYGISHAMRWAVFGTKKSFPIDGEAAARLIQRRLSSLPNIGASKFILTWLHRQDNFQDCLPVEGWAAVFNARDVQHLRNRIFTLSQRGLVTATPLDDDKIELALTAAAEALISRQAEKRRRYWRQQARLKSDEGYEASASDYFYASRLEVRQFKCFSGRETISFCTEDGKVARWTFLIGENGVGKTTVLQALAGLFPVIKRRRSHPDIAAVSGGEHDFFSDSRLSTTFYVDAEFHRGALDQHCADPASFGALGDDHSMDRLAFLLQLGSDSITISMKEYTYYMSNFRHLPRSPLIVGYGASRAVAKSGLSTDLGSRSATHSLFHPEVALQDPEEWLLRSDYMARFVADGDNVKSSQAEKLQRALLNILPDVTSISVRPPDQSHERPWVSFQTSRGNMDYTSLSIGYQSTIAWIVDLAIRMIENYPDAEYPLESPAIVLIDELDIHLHPRWQRSITSHLEEVFPATQFIATTHSPLIIQGAVKANLVLLRSLDGQVEVVNDVDEIRKFRVDQILTSELFGLDSARPDEFSSLFSRRTNILSGSNPENGVDELTAIEERLSLPNSLSGEKLNEAARLLIDRYKSE